jgi:hypothetical protein
VNEAGALQISRRSRENEVQNCWIDATVVMTAGGVSQAQQRDSRRRTDDIADRVCDVEGRVLGKLHRAHNGRLRADQVRRRDTRKRWRVKVSARSAVKEYRRENKPGRADARLCPSNIDDARRAAQLMCAAATMLEADLSARGQCETRNAGLPSHARTDGGGAPVTHTRR